MKPFKSSSPAPPISSTTRSFLTIEPKGEGAFPTPKTRIDENNYRGQPRGVALDAELNITGNSGFDTEKIEGLRHRILRTIIKRLPLRQRSALDPETIAWATKRFERSAIRKSRHPAPARDIDREEATARIGPIEDYDFDQDGRGLTSRKIDVKV